MTKKSELILCEEKLILTFQPSGKEHYENPHLNLSEGRNKKGRIDTKRKGRIIRQQRINYIAYSPSDGGWVGGWAGSDSLFVAITRVAMCPVIGANGYKNLTNSKLFVMSFSSNMDK